MKVFVTGAAGFIGFHVSSLLLQAGHEVCGYDGLTDYYEIELKHKRLDILKNFAKFNFFPDMLEDIKALNNAFEIIQPEIIIHLAAQAGVRYSIENPQSYIDANLIGTFNILELARANNINHLMLASTSSVYGAENDFPFTETTSTDGPLTLYSATKKATEVMAHSYSHLFGIPTTILRFFSVYGPWGRPDMALFKFVKAINNDEPIEIFNNGNMLRDFTYVEDLVRAISLLIKKPPNVKSGNTDAFFQVVNIGNGEPINLMDFIAAIEKFIGKEAKKIFLPMQPGDVPATWADNTKLVKITGYKPQTNYLQGVKSFVDWYEHEYEVTGNGK